MFQPGHVHVCHVMCVTFTSQSILSHVTVMPFISQSCLSVMSQPCQVMSQPCLMSKSCLSCHSHVKSCHSRASAILSHVSAMSQSCLSHVRVMSVTSQLCLVNLVHQCLISVSLDHVSDNVLIVFEHVSPWPPPLWKLPTQVMEEMVQTPEMPHPAL